MATSLDVADQGGTPDAKCSADWSVSTFGVGTNADQHWTLGCLLRSGPQWSPGEAIQPATPYMSRTPSSVPQDKPATLAIMRIRSACAFVLRLT